VLEGEWTSNGCFQASYHPVGSEELDKSLVSYCPTVKDIPLLLLLFFFTRLTGRHDVIRHCSTLFCCGVFGASDFVTAGVLPRQPKARQRLAYFGGTPPTTAAGDAALRSFSPSFKF
jgi:hypothetical protein